ncbi:MAG: type IX secretion system membrane protein PorP/SprF, partial [Paludibacteraceae bacterium]|nr:type IX secretion system membrane protein PorP/SprF [Paludibacteraceae bacterium]
MKKFLLTIACLAMCCALFSQHDIMFSQQFFSRINKNPAGTGNYEGIDLFLVGRLQFVGMDNSPRTLLLNGTGYSEKYKSSVGLSILSDKVSIAKRNDNFKLVYA